MNIKPIKVCQLNLASLGCEEGKFEMQNKIETIKVKPVTEAQKQLIDQLLAETEFFDNDSVFTKLIFEVLESNDRFTVIKMISHLIALTHWHKNSRLVDEFEAERLSREQEASEEKAEEYRSEFLCNGWDYGSFPEIPV